MIDIKRLIVVALQIYKVHGCKLTKTDLSFLHPELNEKEIDCILKQVMYPDEVCHLYMGVS